MAGGRPASGSINSGVAGQFHFNMKPTGGAVDFTSDTASGTFKTNMIRGLAGNSDMMGMAFGRNP